jgi:hypothetical protein
MPAWTSPLHAGWREGRGRTRAAPAPGCTRTIEASPQCCAISDSRKEQCRARRCAALENAHALPSVSCGPQGCRGSALAHGVVPVPGQCGPRAPPSPPTRYGLVSGSGGKAGVPSCWKPPPFRMDYGGVWPGPLTFDHTPGDKSKSEPAPLPQTPNTTHMLTHHHTTGA